MSIRDDIKKYTHELERIADNNVREMEEKCQKLEKENDRLSSELRTAQKK